MLANDCGFRIHILLNFFITWEEKTYFTTAQSAINTIGGTFSLLFFFIVLNMSLLC